MKLTPSTSWLRVRQLLVLTVLLSFVAAYVENVYPVTEASPWWLGVSIIWLWVVMIASGIGAIFYFIFAVSG